MLSPAGLLSQSGGAIKSPSATATLLSLVWGRPRPELQRPLAGQRTDQQSSGADGSHKSTQTGAADDGAAALRRLTAGHRRGHTVARRLDKEGLENKEGAEVGLGQWREKG